MVLCRGSRFFSLLPAQDMVRTGFPGQLEHFAAYAGSAAIAMAGYGLNRGATRLIEGFLLYAGTLEYLLSIFSISRRVGIPPLRISRRRRRCSLRRHRYCPALASALNYARLA